MTNLLPDSSNTLSEKVKLYGEFNPLDYSLETWVSDETLTNYHNSCFDTLADELNSIIGKMSSVDKNNSESIPLATEKIAQDFVMLPANAEDYMPEGLSFEFTITDDILSESIIFPDTVIQTSDGGNTIRMEFSVIKENTNLPYPFTSVQIDFNVDFTYEATGRYDAANAQFTITYLNLYRGPLDNVEDRGSNYYQPINATATYNEPVIGQPTTRFTKTGSTWSLSVSSVSDTYILDNGSNGVVDFVFHFTVTSTATKFSGGEIVNSNNSETDLNGSLVMPVLQWSEFTTTQSPNTLKRIAELSGAIDESQPDLYIDFLSDQLGPAYDIAIEALPNGFNYNKQSIIEAVIRYINYRKASEKITGKETYRALGKESLAEETFVESANYALLSLGIDFYITSISLTSDQLDAIDEELNGKGIYGFNDNGVYDWGIVPKCNTLDMCSRFASATFDEIPTFTELDEHPTIKWLTDNFNIIESEIKETNEALDKVI